MDFLGNNATLYASCRDFFLQNFGVEDKYHDEAEGVIDGIQNSGISLYSSVLNRDLDEIDVLVANSLVDFVALISNQTGIWFGCSSLSSWGQKHNSRSRFERTIGDNQKYGLDATSNFA